MDKPIMTTKVPRKTDDGAFRFPMIWQWWLAVVMFGVCYGRGVKMMADVRVQMKIMLSPWRERLGRYC